MWRLILTFTLVAGCMPGKLAFVGPPEGAEDNHNVSPTPSSGSTPTGNNTIITGGNTENTAPNGTTIGGISQPSLRPTPVPFPTVIPQPSTSTAPIAGECYKGDPYICQVEKAVADLTNQLRQSKGLRALTLDSKMSFVARDWSQQQSQSGNIGHSGFPNARQSVAQKEFQIRLSMFAENVAQNMARSGEDPTKVAGKLVDQWTNSSGHRRNMLDSSAKTIGAGIALKGGEVYGTQIFGN